MSDIKRILAAAEDAEHTRFPCLAVLRYAAATVVMVLALAVVALVIHAVLRSEDIRLSVNDGYIGADMLWSETKITVKSIIGTKKGQLPLSQPTEQGIIGTDPTDSTQAGSGGGDGLGMKGTDPTTTVTSSGTLGMKGTDPTASVTLQRANMTNLRVTLIANNPGGRTKIDCNDTTVTVIDDMHSVIGNLELGNFTVPPQTTITLQKRLKINDTDTLKHIWKYHGGDISFSVKVQVSANVTSYPLGKKTRTKPMTYVCRHVTLGLTDYETYLVANGDVECRTG